MGGYTCVFQSELSSSKGGARGDEGVPVPFSLPVGVSNQFQFMFQVRSVNVAQKLRGTLTYMTKVGGARRPGGALTYMTKVGGALTYMAKVGGALTYMTKVGGALTYMARGGPTRRWEGL